MNKIIRLILPFSLFLLAFGSPLSLQAQCQIHQIDGHGNFVQDQGVRTGQTFTICETGLIESLSFRVFVQTGDVYDFFIGPEPGLNIQIPGPAFTTITPTSMNANETVTVVFPNPIPVSAGDVYRFEIVDVTSALGFAASNVNDYSEGVHTVNGVEVSGFDLDFSVSIVPVPAVPTLSEWGIICLGLVLLTFGIISVRQKQFVNTIPE